MAQGALDNRQTSARLRVTAAGQIPQQKGAGVQRDIAKSRSHASALRTAARHAPSAKPTHIKTHPRLSSGGHAEPQPSQFDGSDAGRLVETSNGPGGRGSFSGLANSPSITAGRRYASPSRVQKYSRDGEGLRPCPSAQ